MRLLSIRSMHIQYLYLSVRIVHPVGQRIVIYDCDLQYTPYLIMVLGVGSSQRIKSDARDSIPEHFLRPRRESLQELNHLD